jgi:predicted DNA-binding WGR domain protein
MAPKGDPSLIIPSRDPDEIHVLQCTDMAANHNKFWELRVWHNAGGLHMTASRHGRVGNTPAPPTKRLLFAHQINELLQEKRHKGYRTVNPAQIPVAGRHALNGFVMHYEASLNTGRVSGRLPDGVVGALQAYLNVVPTPLPPRIDAAVEAHRLYHNRMREYRRLEQMTTVIATNYLTVAQRHTSEFAHLEMSRAKGAATEAVVVLAPATNASIWDVEVD